MESLDLPLIWSIILGGAILVYVILDGFDLGIGILVPLARSAAHRNAMLNCAAPVWDGNEAWLLLAGGGLFAAFPMAFNAFMAAAYIPITLMVLALVLRGVAFELLFRSEGRMRWIFEQAFHLASVVAALSQGLLLGAFIQGINVRGTAFNGGSFDWLTSFSAMVAVGVAVGYALLGASWLVLKSASPLDEWARRWAMRCLPPALVMMIAVAFVVLFMEQRTGARWGVSWPMVNLQTLLPLAPVPLAAAGFAVWHYRGLRKGGKVAPFAGAAGLFVCAFLGIAVSLFPYAVPYELTIWKAAASSDTQALLLVGTLILLPLIVCYSAIVQWSFRGRTLHTATAAPYEDEAPVHTPPSAGPPPVTAWRQHSSQLDQPDLRTVHGEDQRRT